VSISDKIKYIAKQHDISVAKMAKIMGRSPGNVYDWIQGASRPGYDAMQQLRAEFEVDLNWFVDEKDVVMDGKESYGPDAKLETRVKNIEEKLDLLESIIKKLDNLNKSNYLQKEDENSAAE